MQNFGKGKDHSGSKVKHLYVTNYITGTRHDDNDLDNAPMNISNEILCN